MQELPQHEDEPVAGEAGGGWGARLALVRRADAHIGRRVHLVQARGEMGQGKEQGAQAHHHHTPAQPPRLVAVPPEIADEGEAEAGRDVVGAGNQPTLVAAEVEAALDGGDDRVDEAVHRHALQEGGHAEEEQDTLGGVEELQAAGCEPPPATCQLISIGRDVFNPLAKPGAVPGLAEGLGAGLGGAGGAAAPRAIAQRRAPGGVEGRTVLARGRWAGEDDRLREVEAILSR